MHSKSTPDINSIFQSKLFTTGIVLVLAIIARLIYYSMDKGSPLFLFPIIDETEFLKIGNHIAENGAFYPYHFLHPPLYSYMLGILLSIGFSLKGILIFQFFLGISGCVILYLSLSKIHHTAALISALIWAIYPVELFIETKFLSENLYIFLSLSLAYTLIVMNKSWTQLILSAAITGLLIITKTQFLLFFVAWLLILIFRFRESLKTVLAYSSIVLLFPFLATLHNFVNTGGHFIFISSNGPMNLYIGNSEDIKRTLNIRPSQWREEFFPSLYDEAGITFTREDTDPNESYPYLLNSFLLKKTMHENSNLTVPFQNILLKAFGTLHSYETPRNYDLYEYRKWNSYLSFTLSNKGLYFPLVLFFYAALIYLLIRRKNLIKDHSHLVLLLILIAQLLPGILFFNAFRYRLAAIPFIIFYSILFYKEYGRDFNKQAINLVLIFLFGSVLGNSFIVQKIPKHESYDTYADGFMEKGRTKTADKYYSMALGNMKEDDPGAAEHSRTFEQKAYLAEQQGKLTEAIDYLNQAINAGQISTLNYYNRASLKYKTGDFEGAMADYNASILHNNGDREKLSLAWYGLGITHIKLQKYDSAMNHFSYSIIADSSNSKAWANRGILKGQFGDFKGALSDLNKSIEIEPGYDKAFSNRGIAYLTLDQSENALPDFNEALRLNPGYAQVYYLRAMTNIDLGNISGVCDDLQKAVQLGFQAAEQEVEKYCK